MTHRLDDPRMEYYRDTYRHSRRWAGEPLSGSTAMIYMEQGFGDCIMFLRYVPLLIERGCTPVLHAPAGLKRLIEHQGWRFHEKNDPALPPHDFHIPSLDLADLSDAIPTDPYLCVNDPYPLPEGPNVGIAWEGSPLHEKNAARNCPLRFFRKLPGRLICLQPVTHDPALLEGCGDMDLFGVELNDFYDTARVIEAVDLVVSVDTSVLHLAGAVGRPTAAVLGAWGDVDPRWRLKWYSPNFQLFCGNGQWERTLDYIAGVRPFSQGVNQR